MLLEEVLRHVISIINSLTIKYVISNIRVYAIVRTLYYYSGSGIYNFGGCVLQLLIQLNSKFMHQPKFLNLSVKR